MGIEWDEKRGKKWRYHCDISLGIYNQLIKKLDVTRENAI